MYYISNYKSPLGEIKIACEEEKLIGLWFSEENRFSARLKNKTIKEEETNLIITIKEWLDKYFAGQEVKIPIDLIKLQGSDFRKRVWDLLLEIPYGQVTTYGSIAKDIARALGKETMSSQAVGQAVGNNPISIIVPCHRVIGANGNLTGYAGGINRKLDLLKHEKVDISNMYILNK